MNKITTYSRWQTFWLVALRVAIGWHFLYEGLYKMFKTGWTAKHYLNDADGWFAESFIDMADNPTLLNFVDTLNIWGLTFVGLGLIVGCFTRYASIGGIVLLLLFYVSHIPFIGADYIIPAEGNYLWLDKNIIEICALMVIIALPTSHIIGIDRYINTLTRKAKAK